MTKWLQEAAGTRPTVVLVAGSSGICRGVFHFLQDSSIGRLSLTLTEVSWWLTHPFNLVMV